MAGRCGLGDLRDPLGQAALVADALRPAHLPRGGHRARADAAHLVHEMRGLAGKALVGGGQLGAQARDGGGLLVGLRLRGAEFGFEGDLAVAEAADGLAVVLLERGQRGPQPGDLAGLILRARFQAADLALHAGAHGVGLAAAGRAPR